MHKNRFRFRPGALPRTPLENPWRSPRPLSPLGREISPPHFFPSQCIRRIDFRTFFFSAMLCIRGTSCRPVSVSVFVRVCLSVPSRSSTKTAKRRITQTTPHDRPGESSFLMPKISAKFDRGHPLRGRRMQVGWSKSATLNGPWIFFTDNILPTKLGVLRSFFSRASSRRWDV